MEMRNGEVFFGVDLDEIKRGFEVRQRLKERSAETAEPQKRKRREQEDTEPRPAPKLTAPIGDKGRLLDVVA